MMGRAQNFLAPSEIAASVRTPPRLQAGEQQLAHLKDRLAALRTEIARLNSERRDANSAFVDDQLRSLDIERQQVADQIGRLRCEIRPMREERAAAMRGRLMPAIAIAAERAHQAAVELQDALGEIEAFNKELAAVGASAVWLVQPRDLGPVLARLERLAAG